MITNNFKSIIKLLYISVGSSPQTEGYMPVKDESGTIKYMGICFSSFPFTVTKSVSISSSGSSGIHIGNGTKEESENDYCLDNRIISGLTASTPTVSNGKDNDGNLYTKYLFTLTNTTNNDISVSEIGYFQSLTCSNSLDKTAKINVPLMLDRTVLDNPVTVPANGSAAIEYTLKTIVSS